MLLSQAHTHTHTCTHTPQPGRVLYFSGLCDQAGPTKITEDHLWTSKSRTLIFSVQSLLPRKVKYLQVLGMRVWTLGRGHSSAHYVWTTVIPSLHFRQPSGSICTPDPSLLFGTLPSLGLDSQLSLLLLLTGHLLSNLFY